MIRRTNRLRREFIYRKSLEGKERELYEKKRKIRQCLEEGKAIPTELRNSEACLLYTSPSPRDQRGSRMPSSA